MVVTHHTMAVVHSQRPEIAHINRDNLAEMQSLLSCSDLNTIVDAIQAAILPAQVKHACFESQIARHDHYQPRARLKHHTHRHGVMRLESLVPLSLVTLARFI